jgi:predicted aldo/keto reductase-like oxidoreductase
MNYRQFGRLDWKPSALGFGTMRLPVVGGDPSVIDEQLAIAMLRTGIDGGINYVDTAYPYHGGKSETLVGKAIVPRCTLPPRCHHGSSSHRQT